MHLRTKLWRRCSLFAQPHLTKDVHHLQVNQTYWLDIEHLHTQSSGP